jgi:hypothetical protein
VNIPAFQSAARLAGTTTGANPQTVQPRQQSAMPSPSQASNISRDPAQQTTDARQVLDLSDGTLTRRDILRGSSIDIVA